ncbi:hypothetical protein ACLOJK_014721 [Asimina triloba]
MTERISFPQTAPDDDGLKRSDTQRRVKRQEAKDLTWKKDSLMEESSLKNHGGKPRSGVGGTSEIVVLSTYSYPYVSQSQATTSIDRGKRLIIEGEEEEEEEEELLRMNSLERKSSWSSGNPNIYAQQPLYPYYPPIPQASQPGVDSHVYLFGYPQCGYGYEQYKSNTSNDNDNVEEPPRHSFW